MTDTTDHRHHFEIWSGPSADFAERTPIYYVENHNGQCSYGELALDFEMTLELVFETYRQDQLGNRISQMAYLIRQILELRLKSLFEQIALSDPAIKSTLLKSHNLQALWSTCKVWLIEAAHPVDQDIRLQATDLLIQAVHAVDPRGDLFRFGMSREGAFGKLKSYDRVGIDLVRMESDFGMPVACSAIGKQRFGKGVWPRRRV